MKVQIKSPSQFTIVLAIILFSHVQLIYAQPEFPNPNILYNQTHEGDLVLTGSQTMTIENTYYLVTGSIILQDSSQLFIRQSIIELVDSLGGTRVAVVLTDSSFLQADTVIFGGLDLTQGIDPSQVELIKSSGIGAEDNSQLIYNNCYSLMHTFMGNSKVTIRNSYLVQEPLGLVHVEGAADVLFEDSYVGAFFITIPDDVPVTIDSLLPGYLEYLSVKESISDSLTYNLVLRRTTVSENVKGYTGGIEMGWNIAADAKRSILSISNSKLNKLVIGFPDNEPAFLSGLLLREPMDFELNNIHITNTEVQTQWGVFMNGGLAEIQNSEGLFIFMTGGSADIHVLNSNVGEIDPLNYHGTLTFYESSWEAGYEIWGNSTIKINGSVRMMPTVPIFYQTATMTRTYDVVLRDDLNGSPFSNVNLNLSKNGTNVWNGVTDSEGKVSFDIVFDYNNYEDKWILSTVSNTIRLNKAVSIKISNPLIINLELEDDNIHYRSVIHVAHNTNFPSGTRENPYPSIQEAIDNSGHDIIYVHPGTYSGRINPGETRGGITFEDSVTVFGAGADSTILTGDVGAESISGAHISGFTIKGGINTAFASMAINNNVITNPSGNAIWGTHSDFNVINNVITSNSQDAIFLHDSSTAIIKNNIIVNNTGFGIAGVESASATIDYNDVWGNGENYFDFFPAGEHDISEDPMFVDTSGSNFHLQISSPCIDAGDPDPQFNDPDGSRNDIGAFGGPLSTQIATGIDNVLLNTPGIVALFQNIPNPFNEQTNIHFELSMDEWFNLTVYNIVGQKVRVLVDERRKAGHYSVSWDAKDEDGNQVGNGIYFYQISTNTTRTTRKALLLK